MESAERKESCYTTSGASRRAGADSIDLGKISPGTIVETYIAFISDYRERISENQYLGQVVIL